MAYVTKAERRFDEVWEQGKSAFAAGVAKLENPYQTQPDKGAWENGWLYAQATDTPAERAAIKRGESA